MLYLYKPISYGKGEFPVVIEEKVVTVLKKGGYFVYYADPGQLEITLIEFESISSSEDIALAAITSGVVGAAIVAALPDITHSVTIDVQPGEIYYVRETPGGFVGLDLVPSSAEAKREIAETRLLPAYSSES